MFKRFVAKNELTKNENRFIEYHDQKLLLLIIKTKRVMYYIFSYSLVSTLFSLLTANDDDAFNFSAWRVFPPIEGRIRPNPR